MSELRSAFEEIEIRVADAKAAAKRKLECAGLQLLYSASNFGFNADQNVEFIGELRRLLFLVCADVRMRISALLYRRIGLPKPVADRIVVFAVDDDFALELSK